MSSHLIKSLVAVLALSSAAVLASEATTAALHEQVALEKSIDARLSLAEQFASDINSAVVPSSERARREAQRESDARILRTRGIHDMLKRVDLVAPRIQTVEARGAAAGSAPPTMKLVLSSERDEFQFDLIHNSDLFMAGPSVGQLNPRLNRAYKGRVTRQSDGKTSSVVAITWNDKRLEGFWRFDQEDGWWHVATDEKSLIARDANHAIVYHESDLTEAAAKQLQRRTCSARAPTVTIEGAPAAATKKQTARTLLEEDAVGAPAAATKKQTARTLLEEDAVVTAADAMRASPEAAAATLATTMEARAETPLYMELSMIGDSYLFSRYGSEAAAQQRLVGVANGAAVLYENGDKVFWRPLRLVLTRTEAFSSDPFNSSSDADRLLPNFCNWRYSKMNGDVGQLLTGRDLQVDGDYGVVGYAPLNAMCSPTSCGINEDTVASLAFTAETVAHEIGHTLGANHDGDGNSCPITGYVMAWASAPGKLSQEWSTCSARSIESYVKSLGADNCMTNVVNYVAPTNIQGNCLGRPVADGTYCEADGTFLWCPRGARGFCPTNFSCVATSTSSAVCQNANGETAEPIVGPTPTKRPNSAAMRSPLGGLAVSAAAAVVAACLSTIL
ncbi:hypothetical protein H696_02331 [Fonticula alba]|uniref:Peptidase M12B domain-containing protein n=1 Tax=Fonticula alba TaxID=691883 RepID=A0A058ZAI6_FONAL|nr:hypothetical protein H696_02331 [Fonticula alba]KCV71380.1 hypothetical protein H696_02331 [Fonticula alba]|eukprot:XP_009494503.1 hypothetical protein H696_02331 [Fonticula alba]